MTTKNLLTSLLVLLAVAVVSCQKEPSTSGLHEDYLVYTDYDQQADFSDVETFYLPDSILVISILKMVGAARLRISCGMGVSVIWRNCSALRSSLVIKSLLEWDGVGKAAAKSGRRKSATS